MLFRNILIKIIGGIGLLSGRPESPGQRALAPSAPGQHLAIVTGILMSSVDRAELAVRAHSEALSKLDAAEYSLHRMLDEISSVMSAPIQRPALSVVPRMPQLPTSIPALAA